MIDSVIIQSTTDKKTINFVLDNPEIYQMVNGTAYTKPFNTSYRQMLQTQGFQFLAIYSNLSIAGLFSYRNISHKSIEAHIHILHKYHKKGIGKQAVIEGCNYFKDLEINTLITYVPSNCSHVLKFMKDNEFNVCGMIKNATTYKNELVNLFIFERGL